VSREAEDTDFVKKYSRMDVVKERVSQVAWNSSGGLLQTVPMNPRRRRTHVIALLKRLLLRRGRAAWW
jgi:hypothetical protein